MPRTNVIATVDPDTVAPTLQAAAAAGKATFYTKRADGSMRRMAYLPQGSEARKSAEKIQRLRVKKVPMKEIADSMHVSIPTVRRIINNLELSLHIEEGSLNYAMILDVPEGAADPVAAPPPAVKAREAKKTKAKAS